MILELNNGFCLMTVLPYCLSAMAPVGGRVG